jgi:tetratricopeptide (TPR) repeat protein
MRFLTSSIEAQLHREVYVALLNSLLHSPRSKRELAQQAGISPPYLSYLLKLDRDPSAYAITRTPSLKVGQRIVQSVNAPPEIRESLLLHMTLAHEKQVQAVQSARKEIPEYSLDEVAYEISVVREQAIFAPTPALANSYYRSVVDIAKLALRYISPSASPLDYVVLCNVISDCQCVLNRADDALWYAKVACAILENFESSPHGDERDRFEYSIVNAVRQQGVAYFNLGQYREAKRLYTQVETMEPMLRRGDAWKGLILRDKIKAISRHPRFSITEVEIIADEMHKILEKKDDKDRPLDLWLLTEALADAYIRHGNYKDARRVLEQEYACSDKITAIGPLHRVLFLRTYATLCKLTQDTLGWKHFIHEAHRLSREAGLSHQLVEIEAEMREHDIDLTGFENL